MQGDDIQEIYSLTPMQSSMLFHELKHPQEDAYFLQAVLDVEGYLKMECWAQAYQDLTLEYDILRTCYLYEGLSEPKAVVLKKAEGPVSCIAAHTDSSAERERITEEYCGEDRKKKFNFGSHVLHRMTVLQWGSKSHTIIWSFHHIILDGWSMPVLLKKLVSFYLERSKGHSVEIRPYSNCFREFAEETRCFDREDAARYWKQYLEGYQTMTAILTGGVPRPGAYQLVEQSLVLEPSVTAKVTAFAARLSCTVSTLLNGIWGILLARYSRSRDVVFGRVLSGRELKFGERREKVGLFIHTVPIRVRFHKDTTARELLKELQEETAQQSARSYLPLPDIAQLCGRDGNLLDHIIAFENYPSGETRFGEGEQSIIVRNIRGYEHTSYDFNIIVSCGERLVVKLSANECVYGRTGLKRILAHMEAVLRQLILDPDAPVERLEVLSGEEKRLMNQWNRTSRPFSRDLLLFDFLEETSARIPDSPAVIEEGEILTYRELSRKSNQVAHKLQSMGIGAGSVVAVRMKRSREMVIAVYGILKAGAAYLPVHPSMPEQRAETILSDSQAAYVITEASFANGGIYAAEQGAPARVNTAGDLAYIIYTSGTSGYPKGAMIEHHSIVNRLLWMQEAYPLRPGDRVLQKTVFTFDVSVWELFWWSVSGAACVLLEDGKEKDPAAILSILEKEKITVCHFVPSMLRIFLEEACGALLPDLKHVFSSGEELRPADVHAFYEKTRFNALLHNLYGPTECAVDVTYFDTEPGKAYSVIPIGKPILNTRLYILDEEGKQLPIGTQGELCIGGEGVGRGYRNRPELTKACFKEDPVLPGGRIYHTGDLARFLDDGSVLYLGRKDNQVKIRGFRIEPGEVENRIQAIAGVLNVCVLTVKQKDGDTQLVAWLEKKEDLTVSQIYEILEKELPDYMLPSQIIAVERLPVTDHHKVDRQALSKWKLPGSKPVDRQEWTGYEKAVYEAWKDVLGHGNFDRDSNFFHVGGHSLKAVAAASRITKNLGISCSVSEIFRYKTVKELALFISRHSRDAESPIPKAEESDYYALSPVQKGIYVTSVLDKREFSYHMPALYRLEGSFDREKLRLALKKTVGRHEILRTVFITLNGVPCQHILETGDGRLEEVTLEDSLSPEEITKKLIHPFSLEKGPLFSIALVKAPEKTYLFFDMHHIISDGVSAGIFIRDFMQFYQGIEPEPLEIQFKDYSAYMAKKAGGPSEYWKRQIYPIPETIHFPGTQTKESTEGEGGSFINSFPEDLTQLLEQAARTRDLTLYMLMMGIYALTLYERYRQKEFLTGTASSGRRLSQLEPVIGPFVSPLFVRLLVEETMELSVFFQDVKNRILAFYEQEECSLYELLSLYAGQLNGDINRVFNQLFIYQNMDIPPISVDGGSALLCRTDYAVPNLDLLVFARKAGKELELELVYRKQAMDRQEAEAIFQGMKDNAYRLLEQGEGLIGKLFHSESENAGVDLFDFT